MEVFEFVGLYGVAVQAAKHLRRQRGAVLARPAAFAIRGAQVNGFYSSAAPYF